MLGKTGLIVLYLVGAYAAALAQWAVDPTGTGADGRRERSDQRCHGRVRTEFRARQGITNTRRLTAGSMSRGCWSHGSCFK